METMEWRFENHGLDYPPEVATLGPGPWEDEPDKVQWEGPLGMACMVRRGPLGAWCGYVGVDENHPMYKRQREDLESDLDVHGGLTYGQLCDGDEEQGICHVAGPGDPDPLYWLGFDCGHFDDIVPGMAARVPELYPPPLDGDVFHATYKDLAYVKAETERLAIQLAGVGRRHG